MKMLAKVLSTDEKKGTLRIRINKDELYVLEAWQIGDFAEAHYIHMIFDPNKRSVGHLDGAVISFASPDEARVLSENATKVKGQAYKKIFRLDGEFSLESASSLIRLYFPIEELTEEYFHKSLE